MSLWYRGKNHNSNKGKCLSHRDDNKEQNVETKTIMAKRTICSAGVLLFRDKILSLCNLRITGERILIVAVIYFVSSFAFYYYVCAIDSCLCWDFGLFFVYVNGLSCTDTEVKKYMQRQKQLQQEVCSLVLLSYSDKDFFCI